MFRLSRAAEYTIRGVLYLSDKEEQSPTDIDEISRGAEVPTAYLAKLFQTLSKKGFVRSMRGPEGGFILLKDPEEITLLEIIEAVEGPIFLNDCLIHDGYCKRDSKCAIHDVWKGAEKAFLTHLQSYNFSDLVKSGKAKREGLKEDHLLGLVSNMKR
ncbi:MAG: RrF2 family transcriptional regulator [Thermodesulfobacteriota bacterium]